MEGLRRTYDTNVFGPVAVTKAMLPLLRQARHDLLSVNAA
jgi:NAD(P)-dependent dehydrogenase (short-subunit alcohol dehydrogenase family)